MVTLYNVISKDGYIARENGDEDFIPDELWNYFLDLCKKYDVLVMGRKTYEVIQKFDRNLLEPFEKLPIKKIIVTKNRINFYPNPQLGYVVSHSPEEAIKLGFNVLVSSGPMLNDFLLENNLVDKIIQYQISETIGKGIKAFNIETKDILSLVEQIKEENGIINIYFLQ